MGVGDFISSLADTVKSYTPDLTSVYGYTSSTISKVGNAVRSNVGPKLSGYLPDDEGRAKIGRFAWNFGKNAVVLGVHEGAKWVPGGSFVHQTILRSLPDEKNEKLAKQVQTLESKIAMLEKQASGSGKTHNGDEISSPDTKSNSQTASCLDSHMNFQKPEDVISIFMMKEFVGREINQQILENLMVPGAGKHRK